jgi:hypothetical protein
MMVENPHVSIPAVHLRRAYPQPAVDRLRRHGLVGAQRDQIVQCYHARRQQLVKEPEKQVDRPAASAVGDDHQHPLPIQCLSTQRLRQQAAHLALA